MNLDTDLMQSLEVLKSKGCTVTHNKNELKISSPKESNAFLYELLSTLYLRLTNCGLHDDLVITGESSLKDYGFGVNSDWRMIKSGYNRLCREGKISFYYDDGYEYRFTYTFNFS